jgi:hypothetical protein
MTVVASSCIRWTGRVPGYLRRAYGMVCDVTVRGHAHEQNAWRPWPSVMSHPQGCMVAVIARSNGSGRELNVTRNGGSGYADVVCCVRGLLGCVAAGLAGRCMVGSRRVVRSRQSFGSVCGSTSRSSSFVRCPLPAQLEKLIRDLKEDWRGPYLLDLKGSKKKPCARCEVHVFGSHNFRKMDKLRPN